MDEMQMISKKKTCKNKKSLGIDGIKCRAPVLTNRFKALHNDVSALYHAHDSQENIKTVKTTQT